MHFILVFLTILAGIGLIAGLVAMWYCRQPRDQGLFIFATIWSVVCAAWVATAVVVHWNLL